MSDEAKLVKLEEEHGKISNQTLKAKARYDELYAKFFEGQSGLLAEELRKELKNKGEAVCPVCGTHFLEGEEHEFAPLDDDIPKQSDVDAAKQEFDEKEGKRIEKYREVELLKNSIKMKKNAALNLAREIFTDCENFEVLQAEGYLSSKIVELEKEIQALEGEKKDAEQKIKRRKALKEQINKAREEEPVLNSKRSSLSTRIENNRTELKNQKQECEKLKSKLPYSDTSAVNKVISEKEEEKKRIEELMKNNLDCATKAQENFNQLKGTYESLNNSLPEKEKKCKEAKENLRLVLDETGFSTGELAEKQIEGIPDPEEWIRERQDEITEYTNDLKKTEERIQELIVQTKGLVRQDIESLEKKRNETKEKYELVNQKYSDQNNLFKNHQTVYSIIDEEKRKLSESDHAWRILSKLAELADGASGEGGKLSFERYAMGATFREVIEKANVRLEIMSGGQYELVHQMEAKRANASAGLEIEVLDHNTGIQRGTASLSGGESFIVSLSLALGLSDVVQSHAGGQALDTLFIDEGFGTLDDDVLDKAVIVLDNLSKGEHHLVGIISHVSRLEECIDQKIEVKSSNKGSSLRVIVGDSI